MIRYAFSAAALSLSLSIGVAQAAIVETFADSAAFLVAFPTQAADTISFGSLGPGSLIDLTGASPTIGGGVLTLSASSGNLFGSGSILSTEEDQATLVLNFSQPLISIGFSGFISDELFAAIDGVMLVELEGSGDTTLSVGAAGSSFIGLRSDVAFSTVRISVESFDQNATSVAFASLTEKLYPGFVRQVVDVPAPGAAALLLPVLALAATRRRR